MSTYLQLCQRLRQESGIPGTGPLAVTSQTGELKLLVDWIASAWTELQNKHTTWRWMRSTFSVNTVSNDDTYAYTDCTDSRLSAAISRFARWWPENGDNIPNMTIYLTSAGVSGEQDLILLPWDDFRLTFKRGTQTNGFPKYVAIDPQNNLVLGPKPDGIYTINGEYQMSSQTLSADGDTPEMPARFHEAIVYLALEDHGMFAAAQEAYVRGRTKGRKLVRQLESDQLPRIFKGDPLA